MLARTCGLVILLSTGLALAADDAHVIRIKDYGPGTTLSVEHTLTVNIWGKAGGVEGLNMADIEAKFDARLVYWEQPIARDKQGQLSSLRRGYGEARVNTPDKKSVFPVEGKQVQIDKVGNRYEFTIEKKKFTGPDAMILDAEFNKAKQNSTLGISASLANQKVKVGETFSFDPKRILDEIQGSGSGIGLAPGKVQGVAQLQRVDQKGGCQLGSIVIHVEAPVKSYGEGKEVLQLEPGAKLVVQFTYDGCIDGSKQDAVMKTVAQMNGMALIPRGTKTFKVPLVIRFNDELILKETGK